MTIASRHTCEAHTPLSRARSGGWRYIGLSKFQIDGIVPVIPTPFDADEEINWAALRSLLDFAAGADVGAVCLPAYASQFYKPTEAERTFPPHVTLTDPVRVRFVARVVRIEKLAV